MNHPLIKLRISIISVIFPSIFFLPTNSLAINVIIDPEIKNQTFEGWGSSLCWWAVLAGKWSEPNRNRLIDAIVNPDTGLGYNIFRYNIGGAQLRTIICLNQGHSSF